MAPLPSIVFQHFRAPQHQGRLLGGASATLEGRREDATLTFYVREEANGTLRVSYELKGDRTPIAALSLMASFVNGKPLGFAEALTVEQLAEHYDLPRDLFPSLVIALEALEAALAVSRGEPCPYTNEGKLICHCLFVREDRIARNIRERELRTVEEVRFWTRACSGCRSCRTDVEALIRKHAPPRKGS